MGTLFKQQVRRFNSVEEEHIKHYLVEINTLAHKNNFKLLEVIEANKVLELRRLNNFLVNNGNTFDEQMTGLGKILERIADLASSIDKTLTEKEE